MLLWLVIITEPWTSDLECRLLVLMETAEDKGAHLPSQSITGESTQLDAQTAWQSWQVICLELYALRCQVSKNIQPQILFYAHVHICTQICVCTQHIISSIIYAAWHYNSKSTAVAHKTSSSLIGLKANLTRGKTYIVLEPSLPLKAGEAMGLREVPSTATLLNQHNS